MPLQILEMKIVEHAKDSATVELVMADNIDVDRAKQSIHLRVQVPLADPYLPALQVAAINEAKKTLDAVRAAIHEKWK